MSRLDISICCLKFQQVAGPSLGLDIGRILMGYLQGLPGLNWKIGNTPEEGSNKPPLYCGQEMSTG